MVSLYYNQCETFKTLKAILSNCKIITPSFYYVNVTYNKFENMYLCVSIKHSYQLDYLFLMKMK